MKLTGREREGSHGDGGREGRFSRRGKRCVPCLALPPVTHGAQHGDGSEIITSFPFFLNNHLLVLIGFIPFQFHLFVWAITEFVLSGRAITNPCWCHSLLCLGLIVLGAWNELPPRLDPNNKVYYSFLRNRK